MLQGMALPSVPATIIWKSVLAGNCSFLLYTPAKLESLYDRGSGAGICMMQCPCLLLVWSPGFLASSVKQGALTHGASINYTPLTTGATLNA